MNNNESSQNLNEREKPLALLQTFSSNQHEISFAVSASQDEGDLSGEICASDLFSFFTANVIKEDVIFTR